MKTFHQYIADTSPELISENILLKLLPWIVGGDDAVWEVVSPAGDPYPFNPGVNSPMLPPYPWGNPTQHINDPTGQWYEIYRDPPGEWLYGPSPVGPWIPWEVLERYNNTDEWDGWDDFMDWANDPANQEDWDGDGIPNENDPNPGSPFQDSDGDGLADDDPNETDPNDPDVPIPGGLPDSDGDGLPDYLDPDPDGTYDFDIDPNAPDYDPANTDPEIDDPGFVRPKLDDFWKILPSANTEPPEGIG